MAHADSRRAAPGTGSSALVEAAVPVRVRAARPRASSRGGEEAAELVVRVHRPGLEHRAAAPGRRRGRGSARPRRRPRQRRVDERRAHAGRESGPLVPVEARRRAQPAVGEDVVAIGPEAHDAAPKSVPGARLGDPPLEVAGGRVDERPGATPRRGEAGLHRAQVGDAAERASGRWTDRGSMAGHGAEYGASSGRPGPAPVDMLAAMSTDVPMARGAPPTASTSATTWRARARRSCCSTARAPRVARTTPRSCRCSGGRSTATCPTPGATRRRAGTRRTGSATTGSSTTSRRSPTRWVSTTFHLLGFSMGGATALQFAARSPERLQTLVVIGISPRREPRASVAPADDGPGLHPARTRAGRPSCRAATTRCRARAPGSG